MWLPFKTGPCPLDININNVTCYVSPEVQQYFGKTEYVLNKKGNALLHLQCIENYEKNRIYIYGYQDDSLVYLKGVRNDQMEALAQLELTVSQDQEEIILSLLDDFKNQSKPLCQGNSLYIQGVSLQIDQCFPVLQGLLTGTWPMSSLELKKRQLFVYIFDKMNVCVRLTINMRHVPFNR